MSPGRREGGRKGPSGGEGRGAGPSGARCPRWGCRPGSLPPTGLPPGREKRPFRILQCLVGEQGRGLLAFCPAIWRAGPWPRLPLGDAGPQPRQQLLLSPREAVGRGRCGDDQVEAGPGTSDPAPHPRGPSSCDPHLCPRSPLLLWPRHFRLVEPFPSPPPGFAGSRLVGRQLPATPLQP